MKPSSVSEAGRVTSAGVGFAERDGTASVRAIWSWLTGGSQLGPELGPEMGVESWERRRAEMAPGALVVVRPGERGCAVRMPRAEARLLAIEEESSRGGMRRGDWREVVAGVRRDDVGCCAVGGAGEEDLARSSATAAEVEMGAVERSASVIVGGGLGATRRLERVVWCVARRARMRNASGLVVVVAAFANEVAAAVWAVIAAGWSEAWVAIEAAWAWS